MKLTSEQKKKLKEFEKRLGVSFKSKEHLFRALTHKSFVNEKDDHEKDHNERYEFLGDAVLELAISHILMASFPQYSEGELSKIRAAIVNEAQLAEIARKIGLGDYLNLGKGEEMTGGRDKPSLLSDAFEAVIGGLYLDRGFDKAKKFIDGLFRDVLKNVGTKDFYKDYKTRLQEVAQARFKTIPKYRLVKEFGPDHKKVFEVDLFIAKELYGVGKGHSKKVAEQNAAKVALERIEGAKK